MGALWQLIEEYRDAQTYRPSVSQVATRAGLGRSTLNRWQRLSQLPERDHLQAVARVIGLSYEAVLDAALRDIGYLSESEASSDAAPMKPPPDVELIEGGEKDALVGKKPQRTRKEAKGHTSGR
jgi:transcriptional regulator with XRE-family HTH domain